MTRWLRHWLGADVQYVSDAWLARYQKWDMAKVEYHGPRVDWPIQKRLNETSWVQTRLLRKTS